MKATFIKFAVGVLISLSAHAGTIVVGMEDAPAGDRDFQDLIASITGASLQSKGLWSNLSPSLVKQSGKMFWDNPSLDGKNENIGNYVLGDGGFTGGPVTPGLQYLASSNGGMVAFWFSGPATISIIGGITSLNDALGVCPVVNCNQSNTIWIHGSLNVVSNGAWQLTGTDGRGNQWYSDFGNGQTSEFAAFQGAAVPEPGSVAAVGAALVWLGLRRKRIIFLS